MPGIKMAKHSPTLLPRTGHPQSRINEKVEKNWVLYSLEPVFSDWWSLTSLWATVISSTTRGRARFPRVLVSLLARRR
jgi:hypothetical protein